MNSFRKTEPIDKETTIRISGLNAYIAHHKRIMMFPEKMNIPALREEYITSINGIISYLRTNLTDFLLDNYEKNKDLFTKNPLEIDDTKLFAECLNMFINLVKKQELPDLIYVIDGKHLPHLHLIGETVEQAECLECLPGLNHYIVNPRFNEIFENRSIFETRALLSQMNLLTEGNHLDREINRYNDRLALHRLIIKDIIDSLISSNDFHDIKRARIFLAHFDIKADLPQLEPTTQPKKLEYKRTNC